MDNEMRTMIRKIGEDTAGIREELAAVREEKRELRKELAAVREEMRGRKRRKMAGGGGRLDEKDEHDRGKDGTKRIEGEEK
jgi:hypothetical protein